jgi:competence protein ComEC
MLDNNRLTITITALAIFNIFIWNNILFAVPSGEATMHFLNVGQGDATLIQLPQNYGPPVQIIIDGGPNGKIISELEKILPTDDRYIDLVILTHPQLDHYGGLIEAMRHYKVGAFLFNGRKGSGAFEDLEKSIVENNVSAAQLLRGDKIIFKNYVIKIISPPQSFLYSAELNQTSLVMLLKAGGASALFTGDIDQSVENYLLSAEPELSADILKVAHHGSKFSSTSGFLQAVKPKIAVIEVGENKYGHPTAETLRRLEAVGAKIYRTDKDKTVNLLIEKDRIKIFNL